jgi:DNA polymerase III epsilon subunit-like protein
MKKTGIFKLFKPFLDRYDKAASVVSEQSIFVAIDVETANSDIASICQIGLAKYNNSNLIDEASILVNPVDDFDEKNIAINGITEV